ncbi:endonuclease/exonuclease/phosphatase family protein [uncultured Devosia sp.]|uniref:endonuclease/exonuclease/phosphatase family protein n=1 Tax=uncultured Devosia sp. TaxID=211434 RepID=UPI0035C9CAF1
MLFRVEIRGVLTGLGLVAVVLLAAISVRTGLPGQELLTSLRFHIGITLLALPVLLALTGGHWRASLLAGLICLSLGQGALVVLGQLSKRAELAQQQPVASFRMLNFNVLARNPRGAEIADYIVRTLPDVAVILETPAIEDEMGKLSALYPYRVGCESRATCDLSLFSRTPLRDAVMYRPKPFLRERLIVAKTTIGGQEVTLVAVHLSKPYFDEAAQTELLQVQALLRSLDGPVVVSGDFNAAAWSDDLAALVAGNDLVPPPRFVSTWPVELGSFGVPIDNMFSRGGALIEDVEPLESAIGSNHRGLLARISIMERP